MNSGRETSANLPVTFHIKEDWPVECVAKAKKNVKMVSREYRSLPCLWEDNIKRDNLNKNSLGCGQGPVAGSCGHICQGRGGGIGGVFLLNYWLLTSQEGLSSTEVLIHKISVFMQGEFITEKLCRLVG